MNDFDFLAGHWNVVNRRLVKPLSGSDDWDEFPGRSAATRHFGGAASFDEIEFPTKGFNGLTVRVYDPASRQWSIYWASSASGRLDTRPMVGSFDGERGVFYGEESHEAGRCAAGSSGRPAPRPPAGSRPSPTTTDRPGRRTGPWTSPEHERPGAEAERTHRIAATATAAMSSTSRRPTITHHQPDLDGLAS
ncbi:hypothetical protein [Nonomuraea rubra]|uniref:hypothetical protein n=1 Tax=Nonomuraea rubra TaxID=46180 RepID=UPI0031E76F5B